MAMGTSTSTSSSKPAEKKSDEADAKRSDADRKSDDRADAERSDRTSAGGARTRDGEVVDTRPGVIQPDVVQAHRADSDDPIREPDADRVAMVSVDANGDPAQTQNFEVLVHEGESSVVKAAAFNKPGRLIGAKHAERSKNRDEDGAE